MKLNESVQVPDGLSESLRKFFYDVLQRISRRVNVLAQLFGGNEYEGMQAVHFYALTDGATINTDASKSNHFSVTLGGNRTLANPTNLKDGVILNWRIKQDGAGSRTLNYGSKFKWAAGATPTLSTAASSVDRIVGQYYATEDVIECVCTKGFS